MKVPNGAHPAFSDYGTGSRISTSRCPGKMGVREEDRQKGQMKLTTDSFIIDRFYDRLPWPRRWSIVMIGVILLLIPLALAWLTDVADLFLIMGVSAFRVFFPAIVITYILIVVQLLQPTREKVARSLRPLLQITDETFVAAVRRVCRPNPVGELVGIAVGVIFFLAIVGPPPRASAESDPYWMSLYYYVASLTMFGAIGWSVYAGIVVSRLTNMLLRQPIEVDIFDVTPLEPIGTQSLYLSLSFVGATVIGIPSSPYALLSWQNITIFGTLILIAVLVFFLNMYSTHGLLIATKKRQLTVVERRIAQTYQQLLELDASSQDIHSVATELNAWALAKHELMLTRTWPYNTEMLRTLLVSVLLPILVSLMARLIGPLLVR